MMKKLLYTTLSLIITILALNSCKEKEDSTALSILGTWELTQFDYDLSISGISLSDYLIDSLNLSAQEVSIAESLIKSELNELVENETITFKNNFTFEVSADNSLDSGNWELNEDQSRLIISGIADQQIALVVDKLTQEVLQLSINELLSINEFFDTSVYGITIEEALRIEGSFTLIKQN